MYAFSSPSLIQNLDKKKIIYIFLHTFKSCVNIKVIHLFLVRKFTSVLSHFHEKRNEEECSFFRIFNIYNKCKTKKNGNNNKMYLHENVIIYLLCGNKIGKTKETKQDTNI